MRKQRPNFLLIMTDQQRGDCLSIDGHPTLLTPNMDSIAGAGVRFRHAYSTCPVCIPARRSLMTGRFPAGHGMVGYAENIEWDAPPTLPGVLRDAGYQTALVGRSMHLSPPRKRYGFESMTTLDHRTGSDYDSWLAQQTQGLVGNCYSDGPMHNDWTARSWPREEALHPTNWTVDQALNFFQRRDPSCPFFLVVSFLAPHPPLIPPAFYMERYLRQKLPEPVIGDWAAPPAENGIGDGVSAARVHLQGETLRCARAGYYGLINHIDDQLRRLLNPVNGIDRMTGGNTVVLFTSDHGEMLGDHHMWRKSQGYEASARIPFLLRAPQRFGLQPRTVRDEPVCLEDIMPTFLEMAGVDIPDSVQGRSVLPLLRGEECQWRSHLHLECAPNFHALTDGRQKYIWFPATGREQYFHLENDPREQHDLVLESSVADAISHWRSLMVETLKGRPEGFSDGERLIAGCHYKPLLPHGETTSNRL